METIIDKKHHVNLVLRVVSDDGLYIPLEYPLTNEEKSGIKEHSMLCATEVMLYLKEKLQAIGLDIQHIGIIENYTIQTSKV